MIESAQSFPLAGSNRGGSYRFGQGLDLQALKFVPPAGSGNSQSTWCDQIDEISDSKGEYYDVVEL